MRRPPAALLIALLLPPALLLMAVAPAPPNAAAHYLDQFVERSADPRNDFWQFSVGKWLKAHPIPGNEASWGIGNVIQDETYLRLRRLSESAASSRPQRGTSAQKIADFWQTAMDTVTIAKQGYAPLASEFARIEAARTVDDLATTIGHLQYIGVGALYGLFIGQDERNSDRYAVHLYQGGLGLPDRDYYDDTDDHAKMLRREYVAHVGRMFRLLGDDSVRATANAATVMAIETELAAASRKLADLRDPVRNYNAMAVSAVDTLVPSIRWRTHLAAAKIDGVDTVVVGQPEFFQAVERSLRTRPPNGRRTSAGSSRTASRRKRGAASTRRTFTSSARSSTAFRRAVRAGSGRSTRRSASSATRSASSTSRSTSRHARSSATNDSPTTSSPPSANASPRSTG